MIACPRRLKSRRSSVVSRLPLLKESRIFPFSFLPMFNSAPDALKRAGMAAARLECSAVWPPVLRLASYANRRRSTFASQVQNTSGVPVHFPDAERRRVPARSRVGFCLSPFCLPIWNPPAPSAPPEKIPDPFSAPLSTLRRPGYPDTTQDSLPGAGWDP